MEQKENSNLLVFRVDHDKNYKTTNLTCVQDKRLSWKAKGIHYYFLSKPYDWSIRLNDLKQRSVDGKESLYSGIKELIAFGYLFRMVKRNDKKQIEKRGYYVSEIPKTNKEINKILETQAEHWQIEKTPYTKELDPENQDVGVTLHSIKNINSKNTNIKDSSFSFKEQKKNQNRIFLKKRKNSNVDSTNVEKNNRSKFHNIAPSCKNDPKPKKEVFVPTEVNTILALWEGLGLKTPNNTTKTHEKNIVDLKKLLSGKLSSKEGILDKKYSKEEVLESIKNFALSATNLDYAPVKKDYLQNLYLHQFLYNSFSTNGDKSLFLKYLENPPSPLTRPVKKIPVRDESIYKIIKEWYNKSVLGGIDLEFSPQDNNNFIVASNKVLEFFNKHKSKLNMGIQKTPVAFAKIFCEAMEANSYGGNIEPYWLQLDKAFTITLPKYLNSKGMLNANNKPLSYGR